MTLSPALGFLAVFFIVPVAILVLYSLGVWGALGSNPQFGLSYFFELQQPIFARVIGRSFWFAFAATAISLIIGYPVAYFVALRAGPYRSALILLILVPFWISFVIRTYALFQVFQPGGFGYSVLAFLGFVAPGEPFLQSTPAVILGLVYNYIPFMILPLYANMVGFDVSLVEASQSLGAGRARTFLRVTIPLTLGGIVAGSLLVFIPIVAELLVPAFLGGPNEQMMGNLIYRLFFQLKDYNLGSAVAVVLTVLTLVLVWVYFKLLGRKQPVGLL